MKSWEWPLAHTSIAGVFLPSSWTKLDLQDIATLCHIWENSKNKFTIRQIVVTNLRECRNTYVAHNPKLSVTDLEKAKVFDALKDLFKDRDVQLCTNSQECLSELEKIENGDALSSSLKSVFKSLSENSDAIEDLQNTIYTVMHSQTDLGNAVQESCEQSINARETLGKIHGVQYKQSDALGVLHKQGDVVLESLNELTEKQDHIGSRVDEIGDKQIEANDKLQNYHDIVIKLMMKQNRTKVKRKETYFISGCLLLGAVLAVVVSLLYNGGDARKNRNVEENSKHKDCISEKYSYPFEQDMPLLGYFNEHEATVGREWLFETIESKLVTQNSSSRGILLVAEMGFGKSAFVSHLLCSKQGEKGYETKSHIVAFHICRFDVKSTQSPERFIRRLVGFLARVSQEYGNIISMLSDYNIIYNKETCDNDPNACFDQGIIFPLKQLSQTSILPWIFIIEALDECYQKSSSHNPVMELLVSRIRHLPSWFKVFITSRNMTGLNQFTNIEMIHLQTNDPRNAKDIREYMKTKVLDHKFYKSDKELETFVTQTDGNFLFLIHALQYTVVSGNQSFVRLPSSLEEVYRINFDRQFGEKNSFQSPKIIFEIVSATLYPLKEEEVLDVLKVNNITNSTDFNTQLNRMSFFLRMDPAVTITHQSLYEWLISIQNKKYRISIKAGHAHISRYLFRQVSKGHEADLADFSIHVSEASNDSLTKQFLKLDVRNFNTTSVNEAIHKVMSKTSAVNPLKLLFGLNLDLDIDKQNGNGQTPAFLAAANGNIDQLDLLQEKGANISFVMENDIVVDSLDILKKIDDIKQSRYYGYGLIHVAAKHGHANVFSKLLKYKKEMINWKTALGQRAGDIACEVGNLEVVLTINEWSNEMLSDCIYYASKFNYVDIIQFAIARGVRLSCISDEQSKTALEQMQTDDTSNLKLKRDFDTGRMRMGVYHIIHPLDKWWIVAKETPIITAIRAGSVEAASYLIKHFPNILNCSDSFGYTASLLIVKENQYALLPLLINNMFADKCVGIPHHMQTCFEDGYFTLFYKPCFIRDGLENVEQFCPSGTSFAHLIAIYKRNDFLEFSLKENVNVDWNTADDDGNYPIHYAARYTNVDFLSMASTVPKLNISNIKCRNGSTAYHIAAITPSVRSLYALTKEFKIVIPDVKDENGRGVLHHSVLSSQYFENIWFDDYYHYRMYLQENALYIFKYLKVCNHNIQNIDLFERNIMHYALLNGHFSIIEHVESNYPSEFRRMLSHADSNKMTPIQYAIREAKSVKSRSSLEQGILVYSNMSDIGSYLNKFNRFEHCILKKITCVTFLQSWEIAFIFTIRRLSSDEFQTFIEPFLFQFLIKSKYVSNAILTFYKQVPDAVLRKHIIISLDTDTQPSADLLKEIAIYRPTVFYQCEQSLKRSLLYYLVLKDKCRLTATVVLQLRAIEGNENSAQNVFNCVDYRGFNVFHYALMKGDIDTAQFLLTDMDKNDIGNIEDVIMVTILSKKKSLKPCLNTEHSYYLHYQLGKDSDSHIKEEHDSFLSYFIRKYKGILQPSDFCKSNSKMLSVVHFLFASNMKITLKTIIEIYGHDILNCVNSDRITPKYIGQLFEFENLDEFFYRSTKTVQPFQHAEKYLFLMLLTDILQGHTLDNLPYCIFKYRQRGNRFHVTQIAKDNTCIEQYFGIIRRSFVQYVKPVYLYGKCMSQRTIINILRSKIHVEKGLHMKCIDLLGMANNLKTLLNDVLTCTASELGGLTVQRSFAFILIERLNIQILKLSDNRTYCNETEENIKLNRKTLRNIIHLVRNIIVYMLKWQRESLIQTAFHNILFDMRYVQVFSHKSPEYFLSKILTIKTESMARVVSRDGWKLNYLWDLRRTPAYRALKEKVSFRYVLN